MSFTTDLAPAVHGADAVFIAVGTPSRRGDGHADLSYVYAAAEDIAGRWKALRSSSTNRPFRSAPATRSSASSASFGPNADFAVVSNPEFLREGAAIEDFKRPDRVVIGTEDPRAREVMSEIYRPLDLNQPPLLFVGRRTSELTKYAANAFLAMKITFINEIADLCEKAGADVQDVARGIGLDNRIGHKFLHAGPGYGGSCFPKDTLALLKTGQDDGAPLRIVETVVAVNDARKRAMARKVIACAGRFGARQDESRCWASPSSPTPTTCATRRRSPSSPALAGDGARVHAYDPESMEQARPLMPEVVFSTTPTLRSRAPTPW